MEPVCGIVVVDKPRGMSSRQAVDRVARLARPAKAGHAGTLDPLATGVLVVCLGRATKLLGYVQGQRKRYEAAFRLGVSSDTLDATGIVSELAGAPVPGREEIEMALGEFRGEISQRPPAFSALKVAGRRAYALARRGRTVELAPRSVTIYRLELRGYEYPMVRLTMECSAGTYVRSLGRDLAESLGTCAIMTELARTAVGRFTLDGACELATLDEQKLRGQVLPAAAAVEDLEQRWLSAEQLVEVSHGRPIALDDEPAGEVAALDRAGELVAVLQCRAGLWYPSPNLAPACD